jgi:hypothetical protein
LRCQHVEISANAGPVRESTVSSTPVRLGFVPLNDCAPLVVAQEHGLFERFGVNVRLSRELGWATVRDKIIARRARCRACALRPAARAGTRCELPPHAHRGRPGAEPERQRDHPQRGAVAGRCPRCADPARLLTANRGRRTLTFGTVSPYSTHTLLLRRWLTQAGADFGRDVRFVVVPPPQMVVNLAAGHLDGFCAGEPWNSLAVTEGCGWIPADQLRSVAAASGEGAARHRRLCRTARAGTSGACSRPCWRPAPIATCRPISTALAELLSDRRYLGQPAGVIGRGFPGAFRLRPCGSVRRWRTSSFSTASPPTCRRRTRRLWIARHLLDGAARDKFSAEQLAQIFRADLFARAQELRIRHPPS